jgi:outer membrane protein TolC
MFDEMYESINWRKHRRWWTVFHDPVLNQLEDQLTCSNPSLDQAYARFQESRALVQAARSFLYPTILGVGGGGRQDNSQCAYRGPN